MRIERLLLERYGRFTDRELAFRPGAPLHVVLGANETGKTTALSAIADLLFGFGHLTDYDFQHESKSLRIGADLRLHDGKLLSFRRRKGNKNTLVDAQDQPLPDDLLAALTGSLTRDTFCREFGLTAEALRDGGREVLKAGGRLAETLAAGSAGLSALSALRVSLDAEADALFTPRKSAAKAFYAASDRHAIADRQLRDAIVTADALQAAETRIAGMQRQKDELARGHETSGRDLRRLERCARTRNGLARLDGIAQKLKEFGGLPPLPAPLLEQWRKAHDEERAAATALRQIDEEDSTDSAAIAGLGVDETRLRSGETIDSLRERRGAIRKAMEDLPKRQEAQRQAQAELEELARRLGLSSHGALQAKRPADPALARVRELTQARARAEQQLADAEARLHKATGERAALQAPDEPAIHPTDPAIFGQRLEAMAQVPGNAERLRQESAQCDAEQQSLLQKVHGLNPQAPSPEQLAGLPIPDDTEIATWVQAFASLSELERAAAINAKTAEQSIKTRTAEIAKLTRAGVHAARDDLTAARQRREAAFDQLDAGLDGDPAARRGKFDAARALSRAADAVADQLLSDGERLARLRSAEDELGGAERQRQEAIDEMKALAERRAGQETRWRDLWSASGLAPRAPAEMVIWRQRAQAAIEAHNKLLTRRTGLAAISRSLSEDRAAIARLMQDHGRGSSPDAAPETLYREAAQWLAALREAWSTARERVAALRAATTAVNNADAEAGKCNAEIAALAGQWPAALTAIGLAETASPAEATTALDLWQRVDMPAYQLAEASRRIGTIEADIANFTNDVAVAAEDTGTACTVDHALALLSQLEKTLEQARGASSQRDILLKAIAKRQSARAGFNTKRQSLGEILGEARMRLGAGDDTALTMALERLEQRQTLEAELARETATLLDTADGLDEATLRADQATIDPDLLPGEIDRLRPAAQSLLVRIGEASVDLDRAEKERGVLIKGHDAAGAAREREEASAELAGITRRWLVRAAAARLASRAIERHRAANQDPLMARAGALFRVATADAFTGLAADYDEQDRPALVAARASGPRVPVAALSEGTRDQLFLCLRLALLERRASEPLPFIADDLLSSFDDERTAQMLSLLSAFGQGTQVIVFTHHAHVADLARATVSDADVMTL